MPHISMLNNYFNIIRLSSFLKSHVIKHTKKVYILRDLTAHTFTINSIKSCPPFSLVQLKRNGNKKAITY